MPFSKYAYASVVQPHVSRAAWAKIRTAGRAAKQTKLPENLVDRAAAMFGGPFNIQNYLLTHATIIASVDTYEPSGIKLGSVTEDGFRVNRKYADFRIKTESDKYINNNLDSWSRPVILAAYPTFIGGHNFVEHVQMEELSRGRIIDAVARDIGDSIYVDILIATDRRHTDLVRDIESGEMGELSMGCTVDNTTCTKCGHVAADETEMCFPPSTRVLLADGRYVPISEIVEGDLVVTHTGAIQPVLHTMGRQHEGHITVLNVDGVPNPIRATTGHRFWVMRPETECQCGCGGALHRTVEHERGSVKAFQRRFLSGHNSRIQNIQQDRNTKLEFVPAKEIRSGDYLTFPIPQAVANTSDATENRARLIGYFLAEGSFIKRGGQRVGISFDFGAHEYETLAAEVETLLDAEWGQDERRIAGFDWHTKVATENIRPIRRRLTSRPVPSDLVCPSCKASSAYALNVRFAPGRDDCYKCKVCGRQWIEGADRKVKARRSSTGTSTCTVRLMLTEAAEWFYRYCGEYAYAKVLHKDVLAWAPDVQKHVLFGWLGGDGTQSRLGITGNTASFDIVSQMHVLAARCGWYGRKQVLFDGRAAVLDEVVNGSGPVTVRDSRGWLPSFSLTLPEPTGFGGEVRFEDPEHARVTMSSVTEGFKRVGNWLIYRVRDAWNECYSGMVHNIEVEGDQSYVVEGVAVHNCPHIKYAKGNTFFDEQGQRHRIAELCGHSSLGPHGGVQFIEASWVGNGAFKGAVARNILQLPPDLAKKAQRILASVPPQWDEDALRKAASDQGIRISRILSPTQTRTLITGADALDALAGWAPGGDEGGEGGDEIPAPTEPPKAAPPASPLEEIEKELTKHLVDRVKHRVQDQMRGPSVDTPADASMAPNDSIVKEGSEARRAYVAGVRTLLKIASSDAAFLNGLATLDQEMGIQIPVQLYRAALARPKNVHAAGRLALGREPSLQEVGTLRRLSLLVSRMDRGTKQAQADARVAKVAKGVEK